MSSKIIFLPKLPLITVKSETKLRDYRHLVSDRFVPDQKNANFQVAPETQSAVTVGAVAVT